ncbi:MAG: threonylcarbamoyl-AMP synthase [Saprospiraceae bacterium]|nr:threonylcarbamoyl-AMP synthase [Saprospiraceae bacterium]
MIGNDINFASELLKTGNVVGIPTETVYGLAANALNVEAVLKVFEVKNRPHFDPLIIHVSDVSEMDKYVKYIPDVLRNLAEKCMPGPITLLLEKKEIIPDLVTSGSPFVAIRIPSHTMTRQLLQKCDFPLAAPSANPFGYISPTTAQHVEDQLGDKIPYILDGGPCEVGLESTIVGIENGKVTVFRKGGLPVDTIENILGHPVELKLHSSSQPSAPGMLSLHYAPHKPFYIVHDENEWGKVIKNNEACVLRFDSFLPDFPKENQRVLSVKADMKEAAKNLFACMRELDKLPGENIYAELLPERGLGLAINDRLRRAAAER